VTAKNRYFSGPAAQMFKTAIKMKYKNLYLDTPVSVKIQKKPGSYPEKPDIFSIAVEDYQEALSPKL